MDREFSFQPDKAAVLLSLMANGGRLRVFKLILDDEWDVSSLAKAVDLSQSALSQHLKKLRDAKVVKTRRDAQTVYYYCDNAAVGAVLQTLERIFSDEEHVTEAA